MNLKTKLKQLEGEGGDGGEIKKYEEISSDDKISKQLNVLVESQFRNSAELGWIAFSMLPTVNIAINELEIINTPMNELKENQFEHTIEVEKNKLGVGSNDTSIWVAGDDWILEKLSGVAYMMLPSADMIFNIFKEGGRGLLNL